MSTISLGLHDEARAAADMGRVAWWVIRPDFSSIWSPGMYALFGLEPGCGNQQVVDAYHPDDRNYVTGSINRAFAHGEPVATNYRIVRPNGDVRHCFSRAWLREGELGLELFGVNIDVTDNLGDASLQVEEVRRHRFIAENARDLIVRYTPLGVLTFVCPACKPLLGFRPEEMVGRNVTELLDPVTHPEAAARISTRNADAEGVTRLEMRVLCKDGTYVWLEGNPRPALNAFREVIEWVDVLRDVGERKAAEEALIEARRAADAATVAKAEFLANMSHELRTPLTSIIGFAELIGRDHSLGTNDDARLAHIRSAGRALLAVVNDVLDFSRLEQGAVEIEAVAFSPDAVVRDAMMLLAPQAQAKGVVLEAVGLTDKGGAPVVGDAARVSQVLLNLLSNAVKFTGEGKVQVSLSRAAARLGRQRLRVSIRDTGIGIPADRLPALFDRFVQADGSISRRYGGAGLGLCISRRLAELMGGTIKVKSRPGVGSCFTLDLTLPLAPATELKHSSIATATPEIPPVRILVAEDHQANRELIRALLGDFDVEMEMVENGAQAASAIARGPYDVVLMDVQMPVMDGVAATRAIRAMPGAAGRIPIIALSANVLPEQVAGYRKAGFDDHVAKPILAAQLFAALERAVRSPPKAEVNAA